MESRKIVLMNLFICRAVMETQTYEHGGGGEGEGVMNGERSMETYTPLYVKHMASRNLLLRELKPGLRDNLERWDGVGGWKEVQEGGDICIPMADIC